VVHAGHKGMSNVLANLCAATEPVSPLSERDGRTWRFLSTGLQHAAAAILHILLRNGGGPLLSSTVTFFMWEMISADRKDDASLPRDSTAIAVEAASGLTFDVLGIGYFTRTFTESGLAPVALLNMLDDPSKGRPGVVAFLSSRLQLSIPDSEWVCDQINERRPGLLDVEQAARLATVNAAAEAAQAAAAGQAAGQDGAASGPAQAAKVNDHKTAVELDRLHKQLREVFDLLACQQVGMCIHRALPSQQNIHLACSDPSIIEAGRRLNTRCGFNETILQLNTQAFPIITPPAAGVQQNGGATAAAAMAAVGIAGAASSALHKSASGEATPKLVPGQVAEMVYYAGQIVQCSRCSLRFRSPQSCHSLVCPDCVLPIEHENVAAFMRANAQLLPNRDVAGAIKAEQSDSTDASAAQQQQQQQSNGAVQQQQQLVQQRMQQQMQMQQQQYQQLQQLQQLQQQQQQMVGQHQLQQPQQQQMVGQQMVGQQMVGQQQPQFQQQLQQPQQPQPHMVEQQPQQQPQQQQHHQQHHQQQQHHHQQHQQQQQMQQMQQMQMVEQQQAQQPQPPQQQAQQPQQPQLLPSGATTAAPAVAPAASTGAGVGVTNVS
jgi:hypothetical protein